MLKRILLPIFILGTVFVLTGCGHYWGCGSGHYQGHNHDHGDHEHRHYQGCGHSGYEG
ncbi:MAG TPA: hypothetical protein VJ974_00625 [Geopsychrobacteraceae bacterium]|nr:hypothetical protein [Geopsychrobacteraceae bacterium]